MKHSKKHHYVAKGILRRFCYVDEKIHYYDFGKPEQGVVSRDINNRFLRFHYYSIETQEGKRSDILEREFLQVLDSRISEFVRKFVNAKASGNVTAVNSETVNFLRQFIYYQAKRNPDFIASLGFMDNPKEEVLEALGSYEKLFGNIDSVEKAKLLSDKKVRELIDSARVRITARQSPEIMERLLRMNVHFAFAPVGKQFVIGSNPVVRLENRKGGELGDGTVELWTPLTPQFCLGFSGPSRMKDQFLNIDAFEVRKINKELVRQSSEIASVSVTLLKSLLSPK